MNKSAWEETEVEETVKQIIADKLGIEIEKVSLESRIQEDLGADSLDAVEIIMELEDRFKITVPDEKADNISTVSEAVNLLEELLGKKNNRNKKE